MLAAIVPMVMAVEESNGVTSNQFSEKHYSLFIML
jgi:hypothetical protein